MESVAIGINKMDDAFTALAAANPQPKVTDQYSISKRPFAEIEEGETSDEYDDIIQLLVKTRNHQKVKI